jgi:hypothetical protein
LTSVSPWSAAKKILERYTPDETSKRATYRMLAEYYGQAV